MRQLHNIEPFCFEDSKVLILGSFPSVKSREEGFFYAHPQNRFWRVIANLYGFPVPMDTEQKRRLLRACGLALWDVVASCEIQGSKDSSVQNVVVNNLAPLLAGSRIDRIFTNGGLSSRLYERYIFPETGIKATALPSTSPANAAFSFERLISEWAIIKTPSF